MRLLIDENLIDEVSRRWGSVVDLIRDHDMIQVHPGRIEVLDFPA